MSERKRKTAKKTAVSYALIDRVGEVGDPMYRLLDELVDRFHDDDLREARIALAWCTSWKADADGRVTLGKCRRATALDRELSQWDFVILLNKDFWTHPKVTALQRRALLDHELCHAAIKLDENGEPQLDDRDRVVYRTRKHDIEEFASIADRYGCYKKDLEAFAQALNRAEARADRSTYVGAETLARELLAVGVAVTVEMIGTWSQPMRLEARRWTLLKAESSGLFDTPAPDFVLEAARPAPTTREEALQRAGEGSGTDAAAGQ